MEDDRDELDRTENWEPCVEGRFEDGGKRESIQFGADITSVHSGRQSSQKTKIVTSSDDLQVIKKTS